MVYRNRRYRLLKENVKYKIAQNNDNIFYAIKQDGYINIKKRGKGKDVIWIDPSCWVNVKVILKSDIYDNCDFCYLLLENEFCLHFIVELYSKKIIKVINDSDLLRYYKKTEKETKDVVFVLWDQDENFYSVWSLQSGYLFRTFDFKKITVYSCGAIIDEKLSVDDEGFSIDISSYDEICESIYYSREKDRYIYLLDDERSLFVYMRRDPTCDNCLIVETEKWTVRYDKETGEFTRKLYADEQDVDWSNYTDIAYEGYSRQYLGLDD